MRKPFQGVINIIRFNWHFYVIAILSVTIMIAVAANCDEPFKQLFIPASLLISVTTMVSLLVSFYVYDVSGLYDLKWLQTSEDKQFVVNINAGFDETSDLLAEKFPNVTLQSFDFYDPEKHTEVSIKRARNAYPVFPGTQSITTTKIPLGNETADKIIVCLAAHEIRDDRERVLFFEELRRILKATGEIFVVEHLRDGANFLAYNMGYLHFHSKQAWLKTFYAAGFQSIAEVKHTLFITIFILNKNDHSS